MLAKKFGFGFGIAVILPMLVHYGVSTFSPQPKWVDYYGSEYYQESTPEEKKELQEKRKKKDDAFRSRRKVFEQRLFFIAIPVGIAAIITGAILAVQAIGAGLIFGGIFTLIDGYCCYWSELQDWMRFLSLLAAFIVIVFCGYMNLNNKNEFHAAAL